MGTAVVDAPPPAAGSLGSLAKSQPQILAAEFTPSMLSYGSGSTGTAPLDASKLQNYVRQYAAATTTTAAANSSAFEDDDYDYLPNSSQTTGILLSRISSIHAALL